MVCKECERLKGRIKELEAQLAKHLDPKSMVLWSAEGALVEWADRLSAEAAKAIKEKRDDCLFDGKGRPHLD
jgi:hypothetical protein